MSRKSVLVIDDDPEILKIIKSMLEVGGYHVITAANGIEANTKIFTGKIMPSLMLVDVALGILSGDELVKLYRNSEYTKNVPMIFLSGKNEEELKDLTQATGAKGYITKPFDIEKLLTQVGEFI